MSHSKFPWSTHPQVPTGVYDADGMKVAVAVSMTAEEDAALIAAIPAMVEALEEIEDLGVNGATPGRLANIASAALASLPAPEAAPTREDIAKIIDPDAKFEDIDGVQWSKFELQRRELAYQKADAILALKAAPAK